MSMLDAFPVIREHINLYKTDPTKAHDWQPPGSPGPKPTLLLTTKGRKTAQPREIPLIYGRSGDRFVVVASLGGAPENPSWFKNLLADPNAEIQVGVDHYSVKARAAEGDERAELWNLMSEIFPPYIEYAGIAEGIREIPVVVLEVR